MIDTHAHVDFKEFDPDRDDVIRRYFDNGGEKLINVGCDMRSSERSSDLAMKHENIYCSVGIHPHDADSLDSKNLAKLEQLCLHYKAVAIGEIGLDFFRNLSPQDMQIEAFESQLDMAFRHNKPVILHCRDAYNEMIDVLDGFSTEKWHGVVHCFSAGWEIAEKFLDMGFCLGFTGIITYYKENAPTSDISEMHDVIRKMPLDRMLIETDCPYLSPVPYRGERNEPLHVKFTLEKISNLRNEDIKNIERETSKNAVNLFHL
ncbi:MAG: TatD family hydrolase [Candidatus Paceibacterota bacterium]|jgi:TatD DNase family protein